MTPAKRVARLAPTIFTEFTLLAQKHGAVNLGQGFPDFDGPAEVKEAAIEAIRNGVNQYAAGPGAPDLRKAIAAHAERFYGQKLDPNENISVTSGATEAIFDAIVALVDPGDEVIVFEPFYDSYLASIEIAGGVAVPVRLRPPDSQHAAFWFDSDELRNSFSEKTKLLLLNTPHNPTGKVFTQSELEEIAELCQRHDIAVVTDEVYEHLVYAPAKHIRFATLPGMHERTLSISSAGKTFALTGWKIGWAMGPRELRGALQSVHQYVTFATSAPMQAAIAKALALPDRFYLELRNDYQRKRDSLSESLRAAGLTTLPAEGAYFVLAESKLKSDFDYCRWLTENGVAAIPISAFYSAQHAHLAAPLARFAFCKREETLAEAARRLAKMPAK